MMACSRPFHIKASKEFMQLLNMAKAKALMNGKKIPSNRKLTAIIARKLKNEGIDIDDAIKF